MAAVRVPFQLYLGRIAAVRKVTLKHQHLPHIVAVLSALEAATVEYAAPQAALAHHKICKVF